jgi:hypothetical protein
VLEDRVSSALRDHPELPSCWPAGLSAGIASVSAAEVGAVDVDSLIAIADGDMYQRRGDRRRS